MDALLGFRGAAARAAARIFRHIIASDDVSLVPCHPKIVRAGHGIAGWNRRIVIHAKLDGTIEQYALKAEKAH